MKDSLSVMLLQSSNQAANALAEHVVVEAFADMMNEKAEIRLPGKQFENPSGFNDEAHLTSAYEAAPIGAAKIFRSGDP